MKIDISALNRKVSCFDKARSLKLSTTDEAEARSLAKLGDAVAKHGINSIVLALVEVGVVKV